MSQYDFSILNSTDLEDLVCDLLNAQQTTGSEISYRTFKEGKDRGIDILHSTPHSTYCHVGQVKHYFRSGLSKLLHDLAKDEVPKVKNLNPEKYILATSVDLGIDDVEKIKIIFDPYIKDIKDIYGRKDLNRLLDEYPNVVNKHYKLWFSSTAVLTNILTSDLEFRTKDYLVTDLARTIRLYVETESLATARKILNETKVLFITGEPGAGKTTLADMIAYGFIKDDYKLHYIFDDIKEVERILNPDDSRQLIYYDDFLGSNELSIDKAKAGETALSRIIRRIQGSKNKYLVATTRSHLFNMAIETSEKLRRLNIKKNSSILPLKDYTDAIKNQILSNHIEESDFRPELKELIKRKNITEYIVEHPNFTPRSVEFVTNKDHVNDFTVSSYEAFIKEIFDNPKEIWNHAYSEQITPFGRKLLNTMMTFFVPIEIEDLQKAFYKRLENENQAFDADYKKILSHLEGGFLKIIYYRGTKVDFVNPSLADYLVYRLHSDNYEKAKMTEAMCCSRQLLRAFLSQQGVKPLPVLISTKILTDYKSFISTAHENADLITLLLLTVKTNGKEGQRVALEILGKIEDWHAVNEHYLLSINLRLFVKSNIGKTELSKMVLEKGPKILEAIVCEEDSLEGAIEILEDLVPKLSLSPKQLKLPKLESHLNELLHDHIENEIDYLKDDVYDLTDTDDKRDEIEGLIEQISDLGIRVDNLISEFDEVDWDEIIMDNNIRRAVSSSD